MITCYFFHAIDIPLERKWTVLYTAPVIMLNLDSCSFIDIDIFSVVTTRTTIAVLQRMFIIHMALSVCIYSFFTYPSRSFSSELA